MLVLKNDQSNHIDETKVDKRESILFIKLLQTEKKRHINEWSGAKTLSWLYNDYKLHHLFFKCQQINHERDIIMIERTIDYLKKKFGLI